jgi:hypothetical protein
MKRLRDLFPKKNNVKVTDEKERMSTSGAILTVSENTLIQIFHEHKLELLEKDSGYIIESVYGARENGPLTEQQRAIHNKINPIVNKIYDMLKLKKETAEQKQTLQFFIRLNLVLKILLMIELFKNNSDQKSAHKNRIEKTLEEMEACGHA